MDRVHNQDVVTLMDLIGILGHRKKMFFVILIFGWVLTAIVIYYKPVQYTYTQLLEPGYYFNDGEKVYLQNSDDVIMVTKSEVLPTVAKQIGDVHLRDKLAIRQLENTPLIVITLTSTPMASSHYLKIFPITLNTIRNNQNMLLSDKMKNLQSEIVDLKQQAQNTEQEIDKTQHRLAEINNMTLSASGLKPDPLQQQSDMQLHLVSQQKKLEVLNDKLQSLLVETSSVSPARYINDVTRSPQPVGLPSVTLIIFGTLLSFIAGIVFVFTFEALMATRRAMITTKTIQ